MSGSKDLQVQLRRTDANNSASCLCGSTRSTFQPKLEAELGGNLGGGPELTRRAEWNPEQTAGHSQSATTLYSEQNFHCR